MSTKKEKRSKKEGKEGLWKLTPLMEIRKERGFPQRLEALRLHSSHRPDGETIIFQEAAFHLNQASFWSEEWGAPPSTEHNFGFGTANITRSALARQLLPHEKSGEPGRCCQDDETDSDLKQESNALRVTRRSRNLPYLCQSLIHGSEALGT
jgi:hypothetical protein